jgi:hypothetical protein
VCLAGRDRCRKAELARLAGRQSRELKGFRACLDDEPNAPLAGTPPHPSTRLSRSASSAGLARSRQMLDLPIQGAAPAVERARYLPARRRRSVDVGSKVGRFRYSLLVRVHAFTSYLRHMEEGRRRCCCTTARGTTRPHQRLRGGRSDGAAWTDLSAKAPPGRSRTGLRI